MPNRNPTVLGDRQKQVLHQLAQRPRTAVEFTSGSRSIAPHIMAGYLQGFVARGLAVVNKGTYSLTEQGRLLAAKYSAPQEPSRIFTAPVYVPPQWNTRPGAEDHLRVQSRGLST